MDSAAGQQVTATMALDLLKLTVAELRQKARDVGMAVELLEEAACTEDQRAFLVPKLVHILTPQPGNEGDIALFVGTETEVDQAVERRMDWQCGEELQSWRSTSQLEQYLQETDTDMGSNQFASAYVYREGEDNSYLVEGALQQYQIFVHCAANDGPSLVATAEEASPPTPAQPSSSASATAVPRPAALLAEGGEVFSIHDCSDCKMLVEMIDDDGVGSAVAASDAQPSSQELRVEMPFAASVVQRVAMLINHDPSWSSGGAFLLLEEDLAALVAAADFVMLEGPARERLHSECGLLPRDVGHGGTAIDLDAYNAVLKRHLGLEAKTVFDADEPDRGQTLTYRALGAPFDVPVWFDPTADRQGGDDDTFTEDEVACALRSARAPPQLVSTTAAGQATHSWGKIFKGQLPLLKHCLTAPRKPPAVAADPAPVTPQKSSGFKQHRSVLRDSIRGITKESIDTVLSRAGSPAASLLIYEETRGVLRVYMENVLRDAVTTGEFER
eukprot:COSAG01_NODE_9478_length_2436_cov_1.160890_2_plen_501_part_00